MEASIAHNQGDDEIDTQNISFCRNIIKAMLAILARGEKSRKIELQNKQRRCANQITRELSCKTIFPRLYYFSISILNLGENLFKGEDLLAW